MKKMIRCLPILLALLLDISIAASAAQVDLQKSELDVIQERIAEGNLSGVERLINEDTSVNLINKAGRSLLHEATALRNIRMMSLLLELGALIDIRDRKKRAPLHYAVERDFLEGVKLLLDKGARKESEDVEGHAPLDIAAMNGYEKYIDLLFIEHDDWIHSERVSPLYLATVHGHPQFILAYIKKMENLYSFNGYHKDYREKLATGGLLIVAASEGHAGCMEALANVLIPTRSITVGSSLKYDRVADPCLRLAARGGHLECLKFLEKQGVTMRSSDKGPLCRAARQGHDACVDFFLNSGEIDFDHKSDDNDPMWDAFDSGNLGCIRTIFSAVKAFYADRFEQLPKLHKASIFDQPQDIDSLLESGEDLEAQDSQGVTALGYAAALNHLECVDKLLDAGAGPDGGVIKRTPLHWSALYDNSEHVSSLLKRDLDKNAQSLGGLTPLHLAVYKGHINCVKLLIEAGADMNLKDLFGHTPLHYASVAKPIYVDGVEEQPSFIGFKGDIDCMKLLLKRGAHTKIKGNRFGTPLHLAVLSDNSEGVKLLLEHGADYTKCDGNETALVIAAQKGYRDCVKVLLNKRSSSNGSDDDRESALFAALEKGYIDCALLIIDGICDLNVQDAKGWTPLHWAAFHDSVELGSVLLEKGVQPGARTANGLTPLHVAVQHDNYCVATVLVAADNSTLYMRDKTDNTPLEMALDHKSRRSVGKLCDYEAARLDDAQKLLLYKALEKYAEKREEKLFSDAPDLKKSEEIYLTYVLDHELDLCHVLDLCVEPLLKLSYRMYVPDSEDVKKSYKHVKYLMRWMTQHNCPIYVQMKILSLVSSIEEDLAHILLWALTQGKHESELLLHTAKEPTVKYLLRELPPRYSLERASNVKGRIEEAIRDGINIRLSSLSNSRPKH